MLTISPWIENHYWSNELMNAVCVKVFPLVVCLFHTELLLLITIALLRYKAVTQPFRPKTGAKKLKYIIAFAYIFPIFSLSQNFCHNKLKMLKYVDANGKIIIYITIYIISLITWLLY